MFFRNTENLSFLAFFKVKLVAKNMVLGSLRPNDVDYVYVFSSCRETILYFDQFTDFGIFLTPNNFFILKIIWRRKFCKIFYHPTKTLDLTFYFSFFLWNCKTNKGTFSMVLVYYLMQDL